MTLDDIVGSLFGKHQMAAEQARLERRLARIGARRDTRDMWIIPGVADTAAAMEERPVAAFSRDRRSDTGDYQ